MSNPSRPEETGSTTGQAGGLGVVGHYEITGEVGRGGAAVVYLARQIDLDRLVALKELRVTTSRPEDFARRFLRESRVAGSLSHPNIVTVYEYFEHDGRPYIVMEYLERGSLRPYVGVISPAALAGVLEGVLAGLTCAEAAGIVHRDLKPENILVTNDGRVKLTDFGIAKATQRIGDDKFETTVGMVVGTPSYMAPEQALGEPVGPWTDLYSVGVMTWEHLVGRVPFSDAATPTAVLLRHANEQIPPPITVQPDVDPALSEWVGKLVANRPDDRFQTAADAWDALEQVLVAQLGPLWRRESRLKEADSRRPEAVQTPDPADQFGAHPLIASPATPGTADYHTLEPQPAPARPPDAPEPTPVAGAEATAAAGAAAAAAAAAAAEAAAAAPTEPLTGPDAAAAPADPKAAEPEPSPDLDPDAYHTYLREPVTEPAPAQPQPQPGPAAPPVVRNLVLRPQTARVRPGERTEISATLEGDPVVDPSWELAGGASSLATARGTAAGAVIELRPGPGERPGSSSLEVRCLSSGTPVAVASARVEILAEARTRVSPPAPGPTPTPSPAPAAAAPPALLARFIAIVASLVYIGCLFVPLYVKDDNEKLVSFWAATHSDKINTPIDYDQLKRLVVLAGVVVVIMVITAFFARRVGGVIALIASVALLVYSVTIPSTGRHYGFHHYGPTYFVSLGACVVIAIASAWVAFAPSARRSLS